MKIRKIAIIGASTGQVKLYEKARSLGYYVVGFAWEKGAVCKALADKFYPISIIEKDRIVEACKIEDVCGVVSNASDLPTLVSSYVAEQLGLNGSPFDVMKKLTDKSYVRVLSEQVCGLSTVRNYLYDSGLPKFLPCVVKPVCNGGKTGLSYAGTVEEFNTAVKYARVNSEGDIMVEEYISGREVSVESISYKGAHYVLQITDKENTGAPHFVELSHHQPSTITEKQRDNIYKIIPDLLNTVGFNNGPTHIELKIYQDKVYLIEINMRGGGDEISNRLVELSTGYDYVGAMIRVATNDFFPPHINNRCFAGIYFLTKQTEDRLPFFMSAKEKPWYVDGKITSLDLQNSLGNAMKDGFVIYQSSEKVEPY